MAKKVDITNYEYSSAKLNKVFDGYRMAVISDLHTCEIGKNNEILLKEMADINPDAVFIAGDMITDDGRRMSVSRKMIEALASKYQVYYGCGNHELKLGTNNVTKEHYHNYRRKLRNAGVKYLNNKVDFIEKDGQVIKVYGLNIGRRYYTKFWNKKEMNEKYIEHLIGKSSEDTVSILIAHNPVYFDAYVKWGADIVLSGHIHGGMIILPKIGGVVSPTFEMFPHYDFGEYSKNTTTLYLSRGLGTHKIAPRINNKPEIMVITLKSCLE